MPSICFLVGLIVHKERTGKTPELSLQAAKRLLDNDNAEKFM
jgi:hypothetical protein